MHITRIEEATKICIYELVFLSTRLNPAPCSVENTIGCGSAYIVFWGGGAGFDTGVKARSWKLGNVETTYQLKSKTIVDLWKINS